MSREMWLNDEIRDVLAGLAYGVGRIARDPVYWQGFTDALETVAVALGVEAEGIIGEGKVSTLREEIPYKVLPPGEE